MTIGLTHAFVSAKGDSGNATKVSATKWNENHELAMASGAIPFPFAQT